MPATARLFLPGVLAAVLACSPALAQQTGSGEPSAVAPSDRQAGDRQALDREAAEVLDRLLGQLHQAKDEASAKLIEQAVWQAWMSSGSPTVDVLVQQAERALAEKQHRIAISILSTAIELEPRHFGALSGLGLLHQELGDPRAALQAYRRALSIHPFLPVARQAVKELELEVEQDI